LLNGLGDAASETIPHVAGAAKEWFNKLDDPTKRALMDNLEAKKWANIETHGEIYRSLIYDANERMRVKTPKTAP
jgi:hypothetical protein